VAYVTGDFNGDEKADLIITTQSGSYWYFSKGDGTFSQLYSRKDLTLGQYSFLTFTTGDFDADGKTDMVITNPGGSSWMYSNGDGTWDNRYNRTDLSSSFSGLTSYTPGDFNHDGRTDLIISVPSGSYWYIAQPNRAWGIPFSNGCPSGSTQFVAGRFFGN
jgi:hypothetical protein